jgi:alanyl-tRNA synthetase
LYWHLQQLIPTAKTGSTGAKVLVAELPSADPKAMQEAALSVLQSLGDNAAVLLATCAAEEGKVTFVAAFGKKVVASGLHAGKVVGIAAKECGGAGGGKPNLAQAGGKDRAALPRALSLAEETLLKSL